LGRKSLGLRKEAFIGAHRNACSEKPSHQKSPEFLCRGKSTKHCENVECAIRVTRTRGGSGDSYCTNKHGYFSRHQTFNADVLRAVLIFRGILHKEHNLYNL